MKAEYNDLVLERWLRARQKGEIVWVTKSGDEIPINKMTDSHLENAIRHIAHSDKINDMACEFEAYISERFGV